MALRGTGTHRKIRRLARRLNIDPCFALGVIEFIWHVTAEQQPDGGIGRLSDIDICDEIFYSGDPTQLIEALCSENIALFDRLDGCRLYVHDWHEWADDAVVSKLVGRRQRFANGAVPRLTKYSKDVREKILAEYNAQQSEAIEPSVREVRDQGKRAPSAHDEHTGHSAPRGRPRPDPDPDPDSEPDTEQRDLTELEPLLQPEPIPVQQERAPQIEMQRAAGAGSVTPIRPPAQSVSTPPSQRNGFSRAAVPGAVAAAVDEPAHQPARGEEEVAYMQEHLNAMNRDRLFGALKPVDTGTALNVLRAARVCAPGISVDEFMRRFIQCHWGRGQKPPTNAESWGLIVKLVKSGEWKAGGRPS